MREPSGLKLDAMWTEGDPSRWAFFGPRSSAARESIDQIALDTWHFNQEAQRFFAALGFSTYNIRLWKRGIQPG
jgi:hypothetical protein